ncbi:MAG: DUF421 domain-containing protein [Clostridia bacterium]|nr:DUF421 domain-containing protein [Clostridia bacterium]
MLPLLLRTIILYLFLGLAMRLMGKRQLAQLEMSELITTLLLSELAALPLENHDIPLLYAIVPILTLMSFEIIHSVLLVQMPRLRRRDRNTPSLLICRGEIDRDELRNNRLTPEELFSALRQQSIADPCEVEYAVLEKNGSLSVIPKAAYRPAVPADIGRDVAEEGMMHLLISDGVIHDRTLCELGQDRAWLNRICEKRGYTPGDLYCLMCNDAGRVIFIPSDRKGKARRPWKGEDPCAP